MNKKQWKFIALLLEHAAQEEDTFDLLAEKLNWPEDIVNELLCELAEGVADNVETAYYK